MQKNNQAKTACSKQQANLAYQEAKAAHSLQLAAHSKQQDALVCQDSIILTTTKCFHCNKIAAASCIVEDQGLQLTCLDHIRGEVVWRAH